MYVLRSPHIRFGTPWLRPTGFGSSAKHPVARALMGSYQKDMLEDLRAKAEKP